MKNIQRTYLFSDTFGAPAASPLQRLDPDALITTDFRSQRRTEVQREFDIYHDAEQTAHILRMICDLDTEAVDSYRGKLREQYLQSSTGVFINVAPRDKKNTNGQPFYIATAREGRVRVVSTPIEALAPIKSEIETLEHLPNHDNGLYSNTQQFRSSYTPVLLHSDHGYETVQNSIDCIPDPRADWHVSYVDRFGNVITHIESEAERGIILKGIKAMRNDISITLVGCGDYDDIRHADNLSNAEPGELSIYTNGNIDIARRWQEGETLEERLNDSAYSRLDQPKIGTALSLCPSKCTN